MKEYEEVRSSLIAMLEELDDRLIKITDDMKHTEEPLPKNFAEQAVQTESEKVLDYLGDVTRSEIEQVKLAIARIDKGGYGVCDKCGEPIKKARLKALPFTRLCKDCVEKLED